jgi:glutamyl-tRNA synthetase
VERLRVAGDAFAALEDWRPEAIESALREAAEREGLGFGKLVHPLRLALTGTLASPGIDQVVWLLGRDVVTQRIADAEGFLRRGAARQT